MTSKVGTRGGWLTPPRYAAHAAYRASLAPAAYRRVGDGTRAWVSDQSGDGRRTAHSSGPPKSFRPVRRQSAAHWQLPSERHPNSALRFAGHPSGEHPSGERPSGELPSGARHFGGQSCERRRSEPSHRQRNRPTRLPSPQRPNPDDPSERPARSRKIRHDVAEQQRSRPDAQKPGPGDALPARVRTAAGGRGRRWSSSDGSRPP